MHTAKIFKNGRSLAVRIPNHLAFDSVREVTMRREGQKLILEPVRKSWLSLGDDVGPLGDDFMAVRSDIIELNAGRVVFE